MSRADDSHLLPGTMRLRDFMAADFSHEDDPDGSIRYMSREEARRTVLHFDHAAKRLRVEVRPAGGTPQRTTAARPRARRSLRRSTPTRGSPDDDGDPEPGEPGRRARRRRHA